MKLLTVTLFAALAVYASIAQADPVSDGQAVQQAMPAAQGASPSGDVVVDDGGSLKMMPANQVPAKGSPPESWRPPAPRSPSAPSSDSTAVTPPIPGAMPATAVPPDSAPSTGVPGEAPAPGAAQQGSMPSGSAPSDSMSSGSAPSGSASSDSQPNPLAQSIGPPPPDANPMPGFSQPRDLTPKAP